jgi:hypothetical protein
MRNRCLLIKNGVPWATVWGDDLPWHGEIPADWAFGLNVIFAELEGAKFNWHTNEYEKSKLCENSPA